MSHCEDLKHLKPRSFQGKRQTLSSDTVPETDEDWRDLTSTAHFANTLELSNRSTEPLKVHSSLPARAMDCFEGQRPGDPAFTARAGGSEDTDAEPSHPGEQRLALVLKQNPTRVFWFLVRKAGVGT